ncbi:hypothetical protein PR002_g25934 [Phytophthora rubi]|uniref:Uncharacterized protein n=1 Tax=Phytophthora rubi TaxID=129364 RepID=A0A6A3HY75_9STRA|nr:hypothetical protein PR002_g25934 [Phytophthora rubi]
MWLFSMTGGAPVGVWIFAEVCVHGGRVLEVTPPPLLIPMNASPRTNSNIFTCV